MQAQRQTLNYVCACILVIYDYFACQATCKFSQLSPKIAFDKRSPEISISSTLCLSSISPKTKRRQQANPHALILNIQAATDHSSLKNCSCSQSKKKYGFTLLNDIPYKKVSHWHGFQPQNHSYGVYFFICLY